MARYINHVTSQKDASGGGSTCNNNLVVGTSGSATALHPSGKSFNTLKQVYNKNRFLSIYQ